MIARVWESIDGFIALGGPVVLVLLCASVVALAIAVAKVWQFAALGIGRHASANAALARWDRGDTQGALDLAAAHRSLLSRIAAMAMRTARSGESARDGEQRVEVEAEKRLHALERGFRALDAIAQLSPLMGLFGTVLGMIEAFRKLQEAGNSVDPSILAGGIWVALLTTAVGLAVAMPTSLVLTWLESKVADERVAAQAAITAVFRPGRGFGAEEMRARAEVAGDLRHAH